VKTLSVKLPDDLVEQLESEARARKVTKSVLVRESLERALFRQKRGKTLSCYDVARKLAGSIKGLPEDLATNPKYFDGFGE
jgi:hypothetical protein